MDPRSYSLTFARLALGSIVLVHGMANTFGVWGGPGVEDLSADMAQQLSTSSDTPTRVLAVAQLLLGLLLLLGPLARTSALAVLALVLTHAIASARYRAFFVRDDGIEFLLTVAALCVVVAAHGPGALRAKVRLRRGKPKQQD